MAFMGEKMPSKSCHARQANVRCGINYWIRKIKIDDEDIEQTMYLAFVENTNGAEIWEERIRRL
jgi:hypothetical protein